MSAQLFWLQFLAVAGCTLVFMHWYLWRRLFRDTGLGGWPGRIGAWALTALLLLLPGSGLLARQLPPQAAWSLSWAAYLWLGMLALFTACFFGADFLKILCLVLHTPPDTAQRRRQARVIAAAAAALVCGLTAAGVQRAAEPPAVRRTVIRLAGLPAAFQGFRIVQLSDIHLGEMTTAAQLAAIVRQVNRLRPDAVVITGDLVDGSAEELGEELAPLGGLQAAAGVFLVTGNHEYYSGAAAWLPVLARLGVKVLENRRVELRRGDEAVLLAGVNDRQGARFGHPPDYAQALGGNRQGRQVILLAHQPVAAREAAAQGADLVLSGHTHGGQLWPLSYLVYLQQPYLSGLHQEGAGQVYVSQGTGCWGPPLRIGTRNEITEIILR